MMLQQRSEAQTFERGTRYFIRARRQRGSARYRTTAYLRHIFRHLQRTPMEGFSVMAIETAHHILLFTSHIHPEDVRAMFSTWGSLPEAEVYPIAEDTELGNPYQRIIYLRTFPNRRTARLPKMTGGLRNYRWVVYRRAGELEGLLIFEEPSMLPRSCDLSTEACLITVSEEEGLIHYRDLRGYCPNFTDPLYLSF